jgi:hypothetical protein
VISVPVGVTWTVKARAFRSGFTSSGIVAATYTTVYPVVQTPTATPASGTVDSGQLVTLSGDPQSTIRYTTDGSTPTATSTAYTTPFAVTAPTTVKARAFRSSYADSAVAEWSYSVRTAKPTISPAAASVSSLPIVSITSTVAGVTIRYTTDATTPTATSPIYSGPFQATEDMTVQALAFQTGWAPSQVAVENYQTSATTNTATPPLSDGSLSVSTNTSALNTLSSVLAFGLGSISVASADDVSVNVNGTAANPTLSGATVNVASALADGQNIVSIEATDVQGEHLIDSFTVWAGNRSMPISVFNWLSAPMAGAGRDCNRRQHASR